LRRTAPDRIVGVQLVLRLLKFALGTQFDEPFGDLFDVHGCSPLA